MKKNYKASPKIFQLFCHIEGVILGQGFRLIPANKFLVKRPNWNTDVPSHQMYIMTGLKPSWSITHNWLGISEIPVSQLEEAALGTRMCVTGSCPLNATFCFFPYRVHMQGQLQLEPNGRVQLKPAEPLWNRTQTVEFNFTLSMLARKYIVWFSLSMLKSIWESLFSLPLSG